MNRIVVNSKWQVIGYLVDVAPWRQEIRSRSGQLAGWYDPQSNRTYDANCWCIGKGDLRTQFVDLETEDLL